MASVKHFFTLGIMWGELAYGEVPFRLVIAEWGYVGTCTAQRRSLCLFYGFYGKALVKRNIWACWMMAQFCFILFFVFLFFHSFVVGFFGRTRWVLGGEFSSLGGFILVWSLKSSFVSFIGNTLRPSWLEADRKSQHGSSSFFQNWLANAPGWSPR